MKQLGVYFSFKTWWHLIRLTNLPAAARVSYLLVLGVGNPAAEGDKGCKVEDSAPCFSATINKPFHCFIYMTNNIQDILVS